jgi:2-polyprenyl-3-methyl-5-hydroxy-6-metoxy-1,4-benzoquinol methylase
MKKPSTKNYNVTALAPFEAIERNIVHRDINSHIFRWLHMVKEAKIGESIVDFGCGSGNLLEMFYRKKFKQAKYVGIDIRSQTIEKAKEKFANINWAEFLVEDLVNPVNNTDFNSFKADKVCSF